MEMLLLGCSLSCPPFWSIANLTSIYQNYQKYTLNGFGRGCYKYCNSLVQEQLGNGKIIVQIDFGVIILCHSWINLSVNYLMNIIWTTIVIACVIVLSFVNPDAVLTLCVDSATQALEYVFKLVAVYSLWLGVFEIANKCNLVTKLASVFGKLNKFLYGNVTQRAKEYLSLNMASNLLGVGNASTPSAVEALKLTEKEKTLSKAGAMLFVLNSNGIQLVPTTVIGLRASLGSANASDVLLPTVICTLTTAILGVFFVNLAYGKQK